MKWQPQNNCRIPKEQPQSRDGVTRWHRQSSHVEKKDPARNLIFLEANKEVLKVQDKYKIAVKENKLPREMIWLWDEHLIMTLNNAVNGEIKIKEVILQGLRVAQAAVTERWP